MKVWDRAGIELATPGTAVRHSCVVRHAMCQLRFAARSTLVSTFFDQDQLRPNVGLGTGPNGLQMLSAHAKTPPLVRKKLNSVCIVCILINSL